MSRRSDKAKSRLHAQRQAAWSGLPRRLSPYEAILVVLAGAVLFGMAWQEQSGRGIDTATAGTKKGGYRVAPGSEEVHYAFGTLIAPVALGVIAVGIAGLRTGRR